jgi:hypothetical protein
MKRDSEGRNPENLEVGEPVVDLAQGRPMVIVGRSDLDAKAWSEKHQYDLVGNYGNSRLNASEDDAVFRCVYVSDISNEPSKDYSFPVSRLKRIEAHHADAVDLTIPQRVRKEFLVEILLCLKANGKNDASDLVAEAAETFLPVEAIEEADELAETISKEQSNNSELGDFDQS